MPYGQLLFVGMQEIRRCLSQIRMLRIQNDAFATVGRQTCAALIASRFNVDETESF